MGLDVLALEAFGNWFGGKWGHESAGKCTKDGQLSGGLDVLIDGGVGRLRCGEWKGVLGWVPRTK